MSQPPGLASQESLDLKRGRQRGHRPRHIEATRFIEPPQFEKHVTEASIIVEYLDRHYPGPQKLFPDDADSRLEVRLLDRVFDNYVHGSLQKIVGDRNRAPGRRDPQGVEPDDYFFTGPQGEHFTVATSIIGSRTFPSWLRAMRRSDLMDDPRFSSAAARARWSTRRRRTTAPTSAPG